MVVLNEHNNYEYKTLLKFSIENSMAVNFILRDCTQTLLK